MTAALKNVTDLTVSPDADETAGYVIYWSCSGDAEFADVIQAYEDAGLPANHVPRPLAPVAALNTALKHADVTGETVGILKRKAGRGAWLLVRETRTGKGKDAEVSYTELVKVGVETSGDDKDKLWTKTNKSLEPADAEFARDLVNRVRERYDHALGLWTTWLARTWARDIVVDLCKAVTLRETGGIYYVPPSERDTLERIEQVLAQATDHLVYKIPAMHSSDALTAILEAVNREVTAFIEGMNQELEDPETDLGKRALTNRVAKCEAQIERLGAYSGVLGNALEESVKQLRQLQANVTEAEMALMPAEGNGADPDAA